MNSRVAGLVVVFWVLLLAGCGETLQKWDAQTHEELLAQTGASPAAQKSCIDLVPDGNSFWPVLVDGHHDTWTLELGKGSDETVYPVPLTGYEVGRCLRYHERVYTLLGYRVTTRDGCLPEPSCEQGFSTPGSDSFHGGD